MTVSKWHHFPAVAGDENVQNDRACDACGIRYGDAGVDERCTATSTALPGTLPVGRDVMFRIERRPLLVAGMLVAEEQGTAILIDSDLGEHEQAITLWHEILHLILVGADCGVHDETEIEAAAQRLAAACPGVLTGLLAAPAQVSDEIVSVAKVREIVEAQRVGPVDLPNARYWQGNDDTCNAILAALSPSQDEGVRS